MRRDFPAMSGLDRPRGREQVDLADRAQAVRAGPQRDHGRQPVPGGDLPRPALFAIVAEMTLVAAAWAGGVACLHGVPPWRFANDGHSITGGVRPCRTRARPVPYGCPPFLV